MQAFFFACIVNIWNSLPDSVVGASTINAFKAWLDKFWLHQAVKYDFTADLTGHRSLGVNTYVHNSGWVVQAGSTAHKKTVITCTFV